MIPGSTYEILQEADLSYLIADVNNAMKEGWVPLGAPFAAKALRNEDDLFWCQAMVRPCSEPIRTGCRRTLAPGQYWGYCGETDMGHTLPVLCTECGGPMILEKA